MGERLAKDVEALFKAKVEQRPEWHRMMQKRGLSAKEAPAMLAVLFGALKEAVVYVAREVDDPPPWRRCVDRSARRLQRPLQTGDGRSA